MYVCLCHAVTEKHIERAVDQGATRLKDLRSQLRVATECGRCAKCARDCLKASMTNKMAGCIGTLSQSHDHGSVMSAL